VLLVAGAVSLAACGEPLEFPDWTIPPPDGTRIVEYAGVPDSEREGAVELGPQRDRGGGGEHTPVDGDRVQARDRRRRMVQEHRDAAVGDEDAHEASRDRQHRGFAQQESNDPAAARSERDADVELAPAIESAREKEHRGVHGGSPCSCGPWRARFAKRDFLCFWAIA
jgi:hypothetical protein